MPAGAWVAFSWAYRMAAVARSGYTSTPIHRAPMLPVPPRHRYHVDAPGSPGLVSLTTSGLLSEAGRVLAAIIGPKSMYRHIPPSASGTAARATGSGWAGARRTAWHPAGRPGGGGPVRGSGTGSAPRPPGRPAGPAWGTPWGRPPRSGGGRCSRTG